MILFDLSMVLQSIDVNAGCVRGGSHGAGVPWCAIETRWWMHFRKLSSRGLCAASSLFGLDAKPATDRHSIPRWFGGETLPQLDADTVTNPRSFGGETLL